MSLRQWIRQALETPEERREREYRELTPKEYLRKAIAEYRRLGFILDDDTVVDPTKPVAKA